ncbi:zinc-ribbon domain-containing protein, partial [Comamonas kerstersii]|uniref:zinc-ribbon domain-containing protein n=1 Tax=Comamonas kerstersii TaxID=225992 RepID=UPI003A941A07
MSLTTCCPYCGTRFRVVADQLRISDGWVRCGRCQEVFDATQALQEVVPPATPVPQGKVATEAAPAAQQPAEMPASAAPEASYPSLSEVHAKLRQAVEPEPAP